jgi:KaiC/GvpD/RAD55 family RecA-like ATPase
MRYTKSNTKTLEEVSERNNKRDGILSFGVQYLDDAMEGILRNDLILLGARSGAGKTQTCVNIAKANIEKGKKVHFIALEAEYLEIERRIKYQLFAKYFFNDPERPNLEISFQKWMLGDYIKSCAKYEAEAASEFMDGYENLYTFYKQDTFDINTLITAVLECKDETDLIIVDHVHYFDYDDDNENKSIKEIAKTARMLTLEHGKPIILVSHLRKRDRYFNDLVPSLEEFHGSSDLYKIATKVFTIEPGERCDSSKLETYFRIVKNRFDGSVTRYIACCNYLIKEGVYEKNYKIGDANQKRGSDVEWLTTDLHPTWSRYRAKKASGHLTLAERTKAPNVFTNGSKYIYNPADKD